VGEREGWREREGERERGRDEERGGRSVFSILLSPENPIMKRRSTKSSEPPTGNRGTFNPGKKKKKEKKRERKKKKEREHRMGQQRHPAGRLRTAPPLNPVSLFYFI